jgi:hypothetical protein
MKAAANTDDALKENAADTLVGDDQHSQRHSVTDASHSTSSASHSGHGGL